MALAPIACAGHTFGGYCSSCRGDYVTGTLDEDTCEFITVEGRKVAVIGTTGTGSCGHKCVVSSGSEIMSVHGKPVARKGDTVTGDIHGSILEGFDFFTLE